MPTTFSISTVDSFLPYVEVSVRDRADDERDEVADLYPDSFFEGLTCSGCKQVIEDGECGCRDYDLWS